jgi:hypothetical protein
MGHQIANLLNAKNDPEIILLYNELQKSRRMKDELSEYASENCGEFIAEAWGEYQNNPNPRKIAKKVAERLLELGRERRR